MSWTTATSTLAPIRLVRWFRGNVFVSKRRYADFQTSSMVVGDLSITCVHDYDTGARFVVFAAGLNLIIAGSLTAEHARLYEAPGTSVRWLRSLEQRLPILLVKEPSA